MCYSSFQLSQRFAREAQPCDGPQRMYRVSVRRDRVHIRATNPVAFTVSRAPRSHLETKEAGTRAACVAVVPKLEEVASKKW